MPTAPSRWCPRCKAIHQGKCPERKAKAHPMKTAERGYGWDWQKFRARYLAENPLCKDCEATGRVTPATEVHHLVKIKHDATKRLDASNVIGLCGPHHDARTARGE